MKKTLTRIAVAAVALLVLSAGGLVAAAAAGGGPGAERVPAGMRRNEARYLAMRDGVRIAVDVWYPPDLAPGAKVPAMIGSTRYIRATERGLLGRAMTAIGRLDPLDGEVRQLNEAGYVVLQVDARGSGASFGTRQVEWSPDEVADYGEVVDWVVKQPWSNGRVGGWGVSYDGNTAEMLATTERPAVKAVAPLYDDFDVALNLVMPGGVFTSGFLADWRDAIDAMDRNDICTLAGATGMACRMTKLVVRGTKPVDGDSGRALLEQAVAGHRNYDVHEDVGRLDFPRDTLAASRLTLASVSPFTHLAQEERTGAAFLVRVGWLDAGTMNFALSRFFTLPNVQRLEIGPWSHGGGHHTDPFLADGTPTTPSSAEQFRQLIAFMDGYLKEGSTPSVQKEIRYYVLNSGEWRTTTEWPPAGMAPRRWYFAADNALASDAPTATEGADAYQVDTTATTGEANRWRTQLGGHDVVYPDRRDEDRKLLTYTSPPLASDVEIIGVPVVSLQLSSTATDGSLFVYLEDVAPDGRVTYVTEGIFRAINRKVSSEPPPYRVFGPYHTYRREDAMPLMPGEVAEVPFALFATAVRLEAGHRIRVAIAGADTSMFRRVPEGAPATLTVHRRKGAASYVELPMREVATRTP